MSILEEKEKEIVQLKKDLKFANSQLTKTLKLYDSEKIKTEKAVAARSEFLSKLSHEARTPMNALIGYSELINKEDLDGQYYDFSMGIKSATNRLLNFFNDLIEISRIESGETALIEDEYKVVDSIKYVINNVLYDIENKGLELRLKLGENVPSILYGDKVHIHQMILNLLSNAIKFTEKGYIALELDAKKTDKISKNGRALWEFSMSVEDTGMGIKEKDQEELYGAFNQFNSNDPYANQGAGLGLTICKYFSNYMGGDISFKSKYGKGSIFTCKILQEIIDDTPLDSQKVSEYIYSKDMKLSAPDARILIVDDSKVNLNISHGLLLWFDIDAEICAGGYEAIELAKKNQYDIIFMDHMMPDIDGVEATKRIRELGGYNKKVPIVALTANTTDEARRLFIANGFNDFVAKPVELDMFAGILERWLPKDRIGKSNGRKKSSDVFECTNKEEFLEHGIDIDKGIVYFAGNINAYMDNLVILYKEGIEKLEDIQKYYAEMDLKNYAIIAHSIKSVMASIGATEMSEIAKENELQSKAGNENFIKENGGDFINVYKEMIEFIGDNITVEESQDSGIDGKIDEIINDIEDFESDLAIEKLKELKKMLTK